MMHAFKWLNLIKMCIRFCWFVFVDALNPLPIQVFWMILNRIGAAARYTCPHCLRLGKLSRLLDKSRQPFMVESCLLRAPKRTIEIHIIPCIPAPNAISYNKILVIFLCQLNSGRKCRGSLNFPRNHQRNGT